MPARKKYSNDELQPMLDAFHTDTPLHDVAKSFGVCHNRTLRRLWQEHFGEEAYKARISRLYGAPKNGAGNPMWGQKKDRHPRWAGDYVVSSLGYKLVPAPDWYTGPKKGTRVAEHTVVACTMLGVSELSAELVVHHKNENKLDNRPENLEVLNRGAHMVAHRWIRHRRKVQRLSRKGVDRSAVEAPSPGSPGDDIV